jgi:glycerate kinase
MLVLAAPNAFKNALTAEEAAHAIERGIHTADPSHTCIRHPIADGGDGTGDLLIGHLQADRIGGMAAGPFGQPVPATFGWLVSERTAIIDMSTASGIRLVPRERLDPTIATSLGTGELLRRALDMGARRILVGMGGSATVDGGMGILQALGAVFLDADGRILQTPGELTRLAAIDLSHWDMRTLETDISILCDVDNPLLGPEGAAAVFGPQKGATPEMVTRLDAGLARLREIALTLTGRDMPARPGVPPPDSMPSPAPSPSTASNSSSTSPPSRNASAKPISSSPAKAASTARPSTERDPSVSPAAPRPSGRPSSDWQAGSMTQRDS